MTLNFNPRLYFTFLLFFLALNATLGQSVQQEKMKQLNYMIGDWLGTSTLYKNDTIDKQVPAFEKIAYKLDQNIITIDLQSESLQLHTIIYYDETAETYYYNPYSSKGARKLTAKFEDGKFIVKASENSRFIFTLTPEGDFHEYGERFENGKWSKFFEDILKRMP